VLLPKELFNETAWHTAVEEGQVVILEKLWDFAKDLRLKSEELSNDMLVS
jgi:hypothetical protein